MAGAHAEDDGTALPATPPVLVELGRLLDRLADEERGAVRVDLVDRALDLLAVLERDAGAGHVRPPRGLRLVPGGAGR